jgi:hypothetical protein
MGLRTWLKQRAEAKELEAYKRELSAWQAEVEEARRNLEVAQEFDGFSQQESPDDIPVVLKRDERVFLVITGAGLIEPRRQRGQYQGGSRGVSIRIAKGVRYRVGAHRGTYVQGEDAPTLIDEGVGVVTDRRVLFQGAKQTREWSFTKLIGLQHEAGVTMLHVSNRQKVSGLAYGEDARNDVELRLDLAVARFNGQVDQLISALKARMQEGEARRPAPPALDAAAPDAGRGGDAPVDRAPPPPPPLPLRP